MKIRMLAFLILVLSLPQLSLADDKTTGKEVGKKVEDAGKSIGSYTIAQRDEAIKSAQKALREMDAELNRMEKKISGEWDKMDAAAKKNAKSTLDSLRKQRNETAAWLAKMEKSSAEAWDEVKTGFVKSYDQLKQSFAKAGEKL